MSQILSHSVAGNRIEYLPHLLSLYIIIDSFIMNVTGSGIAILFESNNAYAPCQYDGTPSSPRTITLGEDFFFFRMENMAYLHRSKGIMPISYLSNNLDFYASLQQQ